MVLWWEVPLLLAKIICFFIWKLVFCVNCKVTTVKVSQTTWGACFAPTAFSLFPENVISLHKVSGLLTSSVLFFLICKSKHLWTLCLFSPPAAVLADCGQDRLSVYGVWPALGISLSHFLLVLCNSKPEVCARMMNTSQDWTSFSRIQ